MPLAEGKTRKTGSQTEVQLTEFEKSMCVADASARYEEMVLRGVVNVAANQAAITSAAGLTASSLVYTLYNPAGSGRVLVVQNIGVAVNAAPAAAAVVWLTVNFNPIQAVPATTTAIAVRNALVGASPTTVGLAYSTATLDKVPVVQMVLKSVTAAATTGIDGVAVFEPAGLVAILPGCYVSIQASTAVSLQCHMAWKDVVIPPLQ